MASGIVAAVVFPYRSILMITLSGRNFEAIRRRRNDALIGLVRNEGVDIAARQIVALEQLVAQTSAILRTANLNTAAPS